MAQNVQAGDMPKTEKSAERTKQQLPPELLPEKRKRGRPRKDDPVQKIVLDPKSVERRKNQQKALDNTLTRSLKADAGEDLQAKDTRNIIRHNMKLAGLPPIDLTNPKHVEHRVKEYFKICDEDNIKPHIPGLAVACGTTAQYLWRLRSQAAAGNLPKGNAEVQAVFLRAISVLQGAAENMLLEGSTNPVAMFFHMRNNYGYRNADEPAIIIANKALGDAESTESIAARYRASVVDVEDFEVVNENKPDNE